MIILENNIKQIEEDLQKQIELVDDVLTRYTDDEIGQEQKQKYEEMQPTDKISLLTNTLLTCSSYEDFETDLIINFDYNNY